MADDDKSVVTPQEDGSAVVTLADTSAAAEAFREGLPAEAVATPGTTPTPKVEKAPKVTPETEESVDDLRKQVEAANAAKAESDRIAREATAQAQRQQAEATRARGGEEQARFDTIVTALESATTRMTQLEADLAEANERGDYKAAAKMQGEMARLGPRLAQLEDGKVEMEEARKNPPRPEPRIEPQRPADPVEAYAAQLAPEAAKWVRAHPEYVTSRANNYRLLAAHEEAVGKGNALNSAGYFADIEKTLGINEGEISSRANGATPRERTMAAPVSRSAVGQPRNAREITLTPAQREAAAISGISEIEYARQLVAGNN